MKTPHILRACGAATGRALRSLGVVGQACALTIALVGVAPAFADQNLAGNVTVTGGATGNLFVTGYIDSDNNQFTFGTESTGYGVRLLYASNSVPAGATDTLSFLVNRSPASWLWLKNTGTVAAPVYANVMRLDGNNQLILYRSDGTTAGLTFTPQTSVIKLGTHSSGTLTGNSSGVITAAGGLTVSGTFTASSGITNTTGALTSPTALTLTAGGTNQNITLTPSGTGYTILNGNVGIGTSGPAVKLDVTTSTAGDVEVARFLNPNIGVGNYGYINVGGTDSQFSGAFLGFQKTGTGTGIASLGVRGSGGTISINQLGNVGIGTITPGLTLDVNGPVRSTSGSIDVRLQAGAAGAAGVGSFSNDPLLMITAGTEKARITTAGNVGIGTTSPQARLQLGSLSDGTGEATNHGDLLFSKQNTSLAANGGIEWKIAPDNYGAKIDTISAGGANLVFGLRNNSAAWTEAMRINPLGNVGIGTTTPNANLDIWKAYSAGTDSLRFSYNDGSAYWMGIQPYVVGGGNVGYKFRTNNVNTTVDALAITGNGNVGIGTTSPTHKLSVKGAIRAQEIIVDNTNWADYVFDESYNLAPLSDVEAHIKAKKHLPGIPSAAEIAEHGVSMGDMQSKLLSKIEELTLHMIRIEKENTELRQRVQKLESSATNP